ncbi:TetR/AcrR family transcriptional regulator [Syntrophomonas curvata]
MKEVKLDRKTRYTRMVLQDSLIELMREKPINKITIKELCEKADVNRTTFYAHYTDQYDLLRKIEDEVLSWAKDAFNTIIGTAADENETIKGLEGVCQYIVENSKHLQVLMSEQGDIDFQKQLFTLVYQLWGMPPSSGQNGDADIKELYFIFAVNGSVGLIQYWLKNGLNQSAKEIAHVIYSMAAPTLKLLL